MKRIGLFTFIVLILYSTSISAEVYFQMDFEKMPLDEPAVRSYWSEQGFYPDTWDQGLKERTVVDNDYSSSGTNSMKVCYPKDEFGTDHTGCLLPLLFKEKKSKEMYASYMFRFSENFSYGTTSFGGKLPGLSGGDNCSGGSSCDGTNGFSARFMWRDGGKIVLYLYHMDKPSTYGEDVDLVYPNGDIVYNNTSLYLAKVSNVNINDLKGDSETKRLKFFNPNILLSILIILSYQIIPYSLIIFNIDTKDNKKSISFDILFNLLFFLLILLMLYIYEILYFFLLMMLRRM
jgi:hypothetical protein